MFRLGDDDDEDDVAAGFESDEFELVDVPDEAGFDELPALELELDVEPELLDRSPSRERPRQSRRSPLPRSLSPELRR
jgi:hypothetical protein